MDSNEPVNDAASNNLAPEAAAAATTEAAPSAAPQVDITRGLSSDEVAERIKAGKVNVNMELKTKSVKELFLENLFTLFNLINFILAILVAITGSWKNLGFLFIVFLNTAIGTVQSVRSKKMVDKLTLLASKKAKVIRDGAETELDLDQIVLDDIVKLGRGDQIPADAIVVSGDAQVNESLLTGESNLIKKTVGSELMSGSFLDSGLVYAKVEHVGADNYVAKINNEAKYVKKVNSEIMNSLNAIVRFASIIMLPLGIALFYSSCHELYDAAHASGGVMHWVWAELMAGRPPSSALLSVTGALLGMIPQGLVLLTSSVLAIATVRLARRRVLAQQLYCIETLARVDVLCLDKTGTITSGHMQVAGFANMDGSDMTDDSSELHFALSNIAQATSGDPNETCTALLKYYADHKVQAATATKVMPFSSAKKWSGAVFGDKAYVMGASQFVLSKEAFAQIEDTVNKIATNCRVLLVARVDGFDADGNIVGTPQPLGFVTIKDEIRPSAAETIGYFNEQGVTLNVISGDDPRTVSTIAQGVGVPGAEAYVDASTLDTPAKVDAAVDKYHVFGRVTPQQKRELVDALKKRGHTVAMTGDGVNDVLALKEADCSVAMASGSDAARNVAELVLIDNDFASMPAVVAEGRRSINNLQRSAALFLTKTVFSMGLAAICIFCPPYPFEPIQMTLINFFCIGAPGFVLGLEPNKNRVQGSFLTNVLKKATPASISVILAACLDIFFANIFHLDTTSLSTMCLITSAAVCVSLIFRISKPFTPLRIALFVFIIAGLSIGILGFPHFFSVTRLNVFEFALLLGICLLCCWLFFFLADRFDNQGEKTTRSATGFGRGVSVKFGKGQETVSSTGSSARRFVDKTATAIRKNREVQDAKKSVAHAAEAVGGKAAAKRVTKANGGIRVNMNKKNR